MPSQHYMPGCGSRRAASASPAGPGHKQRGDGFTSHSLCLPSIAVTAYFRHGQMSLDNVLRVQFVSSFPLNSQGTETQSRKAFSKFVFVPQELNSQSRS